MKTRIIREKNFYYVQTKPYWWWFWLYEKKYFYYSNRESYLEAIPFSCELSAQRYIERTFNN